MLFTPVPELIVACRNLAVLCRKSLDNLLGDTAAPQGSPKESQPVHAAAYLAEQKRAADGLCASPGIDTAGQARAAFLSQMCNDLRTPLNAIIGFTELIRSEVYGPMGDERYAGYLKYVHESGEHLLSLLDDMLDLSRLQAGALELVEETCHLSKLVPEICRALTAAASQKDIELVAVLPPDFPLLSGDRKRINQVLRSILLNAVKHTGEGGMVVVTGAVLDGMPTLEISDSGIEVPIGGVPGSAWFGYRDIDMDRRHEDHGLALTLARYLVESHGGSMKIQHLPLSGSTVSVSFPAVRAMRADLQPESNVVPFRPRVASGR